MRRLALLVCAAGTIAALPSTAVAGACDGVTEDVGGVIYIDERSDADSYTWIYAETNGASGLQRGGANILGDEDPCTESATPDTIIY